MDIKIVSAITRLANYMPLGSYVIYTALETYSFSLGASPAPVKTIIETPTNNYTCYFYPGTAFTYATCSVDQSSALKVSLAFGFFLAMFLSFLKQVPTNGTPPLADEDDDVAVDAPVPIPKVESRSGKNRRKRLKYRWGVIYKQGNSYYLDFGDFHIWGHAALSCVAFGTLSLFSASVSQCLFPTVRPWIFVFTQIILLIICCFIAMFWVDDPSLSIGLLVIPQVETHSTQTSNGISTSTSTNSASTNATAAAPMSSSNYTSTVSGPGVNRMSLLSTHQPALSGVNEKGDNHEDAELQCDEYHGEGSGSGVGSPADQMPKRTTPFLARRQNIAVAEECAGNDDGTCTVETGHVTVKID